LSLFRLWPISDDKIAFEYKVKRLLEGSLMCPARAHVYWNGTFAGADLPSIVSEPLPNSLDKTLAEIDKLPETSDDLAPYLWLDQKYYLADDILVKSDRMSMAHSVEVRPAFLDHRIVEFAATLPACLKIRGSRQKIVLRELMKDKLPPAIINREKIGFDIPAHEWLRGPLRNLLEDAFQFGLVEYGHFFRREGIDSLKQGHLRRQINVGYHLWGLLILFLWMKKWKVGI
jgi:asparagine synthase (glutamine-hydrolysing)